MLMAVYKPLGYKVTREQPIYSTKAHVYQIDPQTKKDWIQSCSNVVPINFYRDTARNTYRIISLHDNKAIVNSTVTTNMYFTKTSQKFGQWSDFRADTIYGLGFDSEDDMKEFISEFQNIVKLSNKVTPSSPVNAVKKDNIANAAASIAAAAAAASSSTSAIAVTSSTTSKPQTTPSKVHLTSSQTEQLKYENDRLKIALAQSSANAKKWEIELQTLKNNNARLTTALQESNTNVSEWKSQLSKYKSQEESGNTTAGADQKQISTLKEQLSNADLRFDKLNKESLVKQEEVTTLLLRIEELKPYEIENKILNEKIERIEAKHQEIIKTLNNKITSIKQVNSKMIKEFSKWYDEI